MSHPICARCSRNARTVDTPRVKVRVETALIWRDYQGLHGQWRCHGEVIYRNLPDTITDEQIEEMEVFRD